MTDQEASRTEEAIRAAQDCRQSGSKRTRSSRNIGDSVSQMGEQSGKGERDQGKRQSE